MFAISSNSEFYEHRKPVFSNDLYFSDVSSEDSDAEEDNKEETTEVDSPLENKNDHDHDKDDHHHEFDAAVDAVAVAP
jgi:hypothetical protein